MITLERAPQSDRKTRIQQHKNITTLFPKVSSVIFA